MSLFVSIYHRYYRIGEHRSRAHRGSVRRHSQWLVDSSTRRRYYYNNKESGNRLDAVEEGRIVASIAAAAVGAAVGTTCVRVSVVNGLNFFRLFLFSKSSTQWCGIDLVDSSDDIVSRRTEE